MPPAKVSSRVLPPARPASCISARLFGLDRAGIARARAAAPFLLRIEDIDIRRCRREFETAILDDLKWLGFNWDGAVRRQSEHFADYGKVLDQLDRRGLIYPCFCSRADIERESAASTMHRMAPTDRFIPGRAGICRVQERRDRMAAGREHCLRLDAARAAAAAGPYHFVDEGRVASKAQPCCSATS